MCRILLRENREIPPSPTGSGKVGCIGKAGGRKPMINDRGKSDKPVVPANLLNKSGCPVAEAGEERGLAKGNTNQQNTSRTQSRTLDVHSALDRVRRKANKDKKLQFTALLHHVTTDLLRCSFYALRRKAAPGVDQVTWEHYHENLDSNIEDLHDRLHRGAYRGETFA